MSKEKMDSKKSIEPNGIPLTTSYDNIKRYSANLYSKLKAPGGIPFGLADFPLVIKMDLNQSVDGLGKFINKYDKIAAIPAIDDDGNFTICFLGIDNANRQFDIKNPGQETWPLADITTVNNSTTPPLK